MTKLVVEELYTTLSQDFEASHRMVLSNVRLWVYKHLSPAGNISLVVKQGGQTLATSTAITSTYLEANTDATAINYFHGQIRFDFASPFVIQRGDLTLELTAAGYTFSESAYFGWVKRHENLVFTQDYTPASGAYKPFGVEFWKYKDRL